MRKPLPLALTLGEPAGIGPDLTLALWRRRGELDLPADAVIVQIGGRQPSELLRTIGIDLVEKRGAA